jgi:hypothetical protein
MSLWSSSDLGFSFHSQGGSCYPAVQAFAATHARMGSPDVWEHFPPSFTVPAVSAITACVPACFWAGSKACAPVRGCCLAGEHQLQCMIL